MDLLLFLILFPLLPAGLIVVIPHLATRKVIARISAAIMAAASFWLAWRCLVWGPEYFHLEAGVIDGTMFGLEILIAAYLLYRCGGLPRRRLWIPALVVVQVARIKREERIIGGYENYAQSIRWRLLPGIW